MPDLLLDSISVDEREAKWRELIERPKSPESRTWIAEDEDRVVAFANTGPVRGEVRTDVAELYALYVDPVLWRRGIGRELLTFALNDLRVRGRTEAMLWVLETNVRARDFYERAGWLADGGEKTKLFGGRPLREVSYRRAL